MERRETLYLFIWAESRGNAAKIFFRSVGGISVSTGGENRTDGKKSGKFCKKCNYFIADNEKIISLQVENVGKNPTKRHSTA